MQEIKTVVGEKGVISLPVEYQKVLDLKPGDEVVIRLDNGALRIFPFKKALRRSQEIVRKYIPAGTKLVDSLIRERRLEAENE